MTNIINIVNFVRGVEPREGRNIDLRQPVAEQLKIMKNNGLTGTFLFQYDALISPDFRDLMNECAEFCEVGLWLEIVEPLVRAVGEQWRGRYPWDWYCDVGFLIGYEPDVRKKLIDECMRAYREIFGKYPRSVKAYASGKQISVVFRYKEFDVTGEYIEHGYSLYSAFRVSETKITGSQLTLADNPCFYTEFDEFYKLLCGEKQSGSYKDFIAPVFVMNAIVRSLESGNEEKVNEAESV
jgi:hypothetical protein